MKRHRFLAPLLTASLLIVLVVGARAQGPVAQAALGTSFTYQGRLTDGGAPAEGVYDLRFILYDAASGGAQVGSTVVRENVSIAEGYLSVELDFGSAAFSGQARYLEVGIRPGDSVGAHTILSPRQALSPAPYALYALSAPWSGLTGVPADLADGDDDTTYSAGPGLTLAGTQFSANFGGSGSADTVSRSDHRHLGQTWTGRDNPLVIRGSFNTAPYQAPLELDNSTGHGLLVKANRIGVLVESAGRDGLNVMSTGRDGLNVNSASRHGVRVNSTGDDGVYLGSIGSPSRTYNSSYKNGVEVGGAEGYGLWVGRVGWDGVYVRDAGYDGVYVEEALDDGFHVHNAGDNGVEVYSAGGDGVYVDGARDDGVRVSYAGRWAGNFNGDVQVTGNLSKGGGAFKIDHPLDPENKYLSHSFVESPDMMNVYNGNVTLDANGEAWIELPEWFETLNRDYRYQLTPIGGPGPNLYIAQEVQDNRFQIAGGTPGLKVSWQVTGIRHDAYAQANRIAVEEDKPAEERGTYLHPQAHGLPETRGLAYRERQMGAAEEVRP